MSLRILIADDDARLRRILRQILAGVAAEVYEAANGREAVQVCLDRRPDWALLDLRMSPLDGLQALAEIGARVPETRVVIVSQYDDAGLRAKALRGGARAYVLKENLPELTALLLDAAPPG